MLFRETNLELLQKGEDIAIENIPDEEYDNIKK